MTPDDESGKSGIRRRDLVTIAGAGIIASAAGSSAPASNQAATGSENTTLRHFNAAENRTLEAFADALLPGAAEAGIARYVDDQLGRKTPLLFLKYMDYTGSYVDFYKQGLKALDLESSSRYGQPFAELKSEKKTALIRDLSQKTPAEWKGPPSPLFYFVIRNDAVDVYYGTPEGFEKLGVPYLAMVQPSAKW